MDITRLAGRGGPLRYAAAGLVNTAAGYAVMLALGAVGVGPFTSNAAGFATGFAVSLAIARGWTFGPAERPAAPVRYAAAFSACYGFNLFVVGIGLGLGLPEPLAQAGGVAVYAGAFYLACRWWVFGRRAVADRDIHQALLFIRTVSRCG